MSKKWRVKSNEEAVCDTGSREMEIGDWTRMITDGTDGHGPRDRKKETGGGHGVGKVLKPLMNEYGGWKFLF